MRCTDPSTMTREQRVAELAEILAAGIQRVLSQRSKDFPQRRIREERLDAAGAAEAPCGETTELPA